MFNSDSLNNVHKFHFALLVETFQSAVLSTVFPNHKMCVAPTLKLSREGCLSGDVVLLVKNNLAKYIKRGLH